MLSYNIYLDNGDYVCNYKATGPIRAMRKASTVYFNINKNEKHITLIVQLKGLLQQRKERVYKATMNVLKFPIKKTVNGKTFFIKHVIKIVRIKIPTDSSV